MQKYLPLITLTVILFFVSSCKKPFMSPERRLEGQWQLDDVSRSRFLGWDNINSPYTAGMFRFYSNGSAEYTSSTDTLLGNWDMWREYTGYYNENGDWVDDSHLVMRMFLADFSSNRIIDWYFDNFDFRSHNRIVATWYTASHRMRYRFDRR